MTKHPVRKWRYAQHLQPAGVLGYYAQTGEGGGGGVTANINCTTTASTTEEGMLKPVQVQAENLPIAANQIRGVLSHASPIE